MFRSVYWQIRICTDFPVQLADMYLSIKLFRAFYGPFIDFSLRTSVIPIYSLLDEIPWPFQWEPVPWPFTVETSFNIIFIVIVLGPVCLDCTSVQWYWPLYCLPCWV